MKKSGTPTKYPGVFRVDNETHRVRAKVLDSRTGKTKEIDRLLEGVSAREAAQKRAELIREVQNPRGASERVRVGEFAKSWIKSKTIKLDAGTARTYADALDQHILPVLGDYYYDVLTFQDVQRWIDDKLTRGWKTKKGEQRGYSRHSVHGWFRVFRTMTRDAIHALRLPLDPTLRVSFPPERERVEANSLTPEQLASFLEAMREHYPQHYALVVLLAYTGLRFCHASALRWEDWDERANVIRIQRKQVRGTVGQVTRKKRTPNEYPVEPELAEILRAHRRRLLSTQAPGLAEGWMFPSSAGTLRTPNSLDKAWARCLEISEIDKRFTIHGLRYTFSDLVRRANVDAVVRRALTGHVTEGMQRHYSTVGMDEKRAAVAGVIRLVPASTLPGGGKGGDRARKN